jgi:hypothetical protein
LKIERYDKKEGITPSVNMKINAINMPDVEFSEMLFKFRRKG